MIAPNLVFSIAKMAAFSGKLCEQRSQSQNFRVQRLLELPDAIHNSLQASYFCSVHWPTTESRESISVAKNDIDITGALRNALFQNTSALVGERVRQASVCASLQMPVHPGVIRPSALTLVISV